MDDELVRTITTYAVIIATTGYNVWKHQQTVARLESLTVRTDDIREDLDAAREALERIQVKAQGGERRAARSTLSAAAAAQVQANGFARRWSDPTTPRPVGET